MRLTENESESESDGRGRSALTARRAVDWEEGEQWVVVVVAVAPFCFDLDRRTTVITTRLQAEERDAPMKSGISCGSIL